jgi:hypothetical protein
VIKTRYLKRAGVTAVAQLALAAASGLAAGPAAVLPCSFELPLTAARGLPTVPIVIGGSPPLDFVIDSGSELTALTDPALAQALGLHTRLAGWGTGMGGVRLPVLIAPDVALRAAGGVLYRTGLAVHDLGAGPAAAPSPAFSGLLGSELFEHFVVDIDPQRGTVLLHDAASFVYRGLGHVVPLTIDRRRPFVAARITTVDGHPLKARLLVDTGTENQLLLIRGSHRHLRVPEGSAPAIAHGVGGEAEARLAQVARLELGTLSLSPVPAAFLHAQSVAATRSFRRVNGILGYGLLGRFRAILDYRRGLLILEPSRRDGLAVADLEGDG